MSIWPLKNGIRPDSYLKWIALLCLCLIKMGEAKELKLEEYLKIYLSYDELYQSKVIEKKMALEEMKIRADFFKSSFNLKAQRSESDTRFPRFPKQNFDEQRNSLTGKYSQEFKWGLDASVEGTRFIGASNPALGAIDEEYSATLSKSLWRDPLGKLSEKKFMLASLDKERLEIEKKIELGKSCQNAIHLFMDAWAGHKSYTIVKDMESISVEALNAAEEAYRKRLMREIDILSARSDRLDAIQQIADQKEVMDSAFLALMNYSMEDGLDTFNGQDYEMPSLSFDEEYFENLKINESLKEIDFLELKSVKKNLDKTRKQIEIVRQEERSDVQLGLNAARRDGDVNIGAVVTDYSEKSIQLFIEMDWPVFNQTQDAKIQKAYYDRSRTELEIRQKQRELNNRYYDLILSQKKLDNEIKIVKQKINMSEEQVQQAIRLIETGKIEFEDFARFRNRLNEAKLNAIELEKQLKLEKVELALLNGSLFEACKEIL